MSPSAFTTILESSGGCLKAKSPGIRFLGKIEVVKQRRNTEKCTLWKFLEKKVVGDLATE